MQTYLLKRAVYNNITFPIGTTISLIKEPCYNFIATKGKLKNFKGCVAEGLENWIVDNTIANRKKLKAFEAMESRVKYSLEKIYRARNSMPSPTLPFSTKM